MCENVVFVTLMINGQKQKARVIYHCNIGNVFIKNFSAISNQISPNQPYP